MILKNVGEFYQTRRFTHCAKAERSRVRFPMATLGFFIDLILPTVVSPEVDVSSNTNEYQWYVLGG